MKKYLFIALSFFASVVSAQNLDFSKANNAFGYLTYTATGAGQNTIGYSTAGNQLGGGSGATLSTNGGALVNVTRTGTFSNPSGNPVTVSAVSATPFSRFAPLLVKAIPLVTAWQAGTAIGDWINEKGFKYDQYPSTGTFWRYDSSYCSGGFCYQWPSLYSGNTTVYNTARASCDAWVAQAVNVVCVPAGASSGLVSPANWEYFVFRDATNPATVRAVSGSNATYIYQSKKIAETSIPKIFKTPQQMVDEIATTSGWPSTSNLSKAAADAVSLTGDKVVVETPTVTGPLTSTGTTTTTNNADGTKVVTTVTHNHTYSGPSVNTTTSTVNNTYNSSNVITTTNNTTTTPTTTAPSTDQKTDCQLFPNSVGCQELGSSTVPTFTNTDSGFSQITPVSFASSASCPSDLTFNVLGHSYAVAYTPACQMLDVYVKPVLLVLAAGLAAFIFVSGFKV